jgi:hypothetical protein
MRRTQGERTKESGPRTRLRVKRWVWAVSVVIACPLPALAFVSRSGPTVIISQNIQDDLYLAGRIVTSTAAVDGDVAAAGGQVDLTGQTTGGVLAAGGTVRIGGTIGRALRAAAGSLSVDATIGSDATLAGGVVNVGPGAEIGRDLVVGGGTVNVSGTIGRNARVRGGDVTVGGTVQGEADIRARKIILLPTARIGGHLRYSSDQQLVIESGARIAGGTERIPTVPGHRAGVSTPPGLGLWARLGEGAALLVLGLVLLGVTPQGTSAVIAEVEARFGRSLLAGFILVVTAPAAAVLLLFTVIGIPLSVVAMLLYLATLYPGQVFVAGWLGDQIMRWSRRGREGFRARFVPLVIGTVVLVLLFAIPYAGWAVRLVAVLAGFGALWMTVWRAAMSRPAPVEVLPPATP